MRKRVPPPTVVIWTRKPAPAAARRRCDVDVQRTDEGAPRPRGRGEGLSAGPLRLEAWLGRRLFRLELLVLLRVLPEVVPSTTTPKNARGRRREGQRAPRTPDAQALV